MYLIGLTGGIASGKSVVAERLHERGAVVVDADALAREVVEKGSPALARIRTEFGPDVIDDNGALDRAALGSIVFADPKKRAILNGITHPQVWQLAAAQIRQADERDAHAVVVYDVPLLVEAATDRPINFDIIVVVHAETATRVDRLMSLRSMTREEATHRINAQASEAERLAVADVVIDSNGTLHETLAQADELWEMASAAAMSV